MTSRVLVVDDAAEIRMLVALALGERDVVVEQSADGAAGLAAALAAPPDAVVLDVQLPGLDGPDVLRALQADARTASVPVVVLTGSGREGDGALLALGAVRVLRKPFDLQALADEVLAVLDAPRRAADALAELWEQVAHVARDRVRLLETALVAGPTSHGLAAQECHKLVGSLDSFGRRGGSALALQAAELFAAPDPDPAALTDAVRGLRAVVGHPTDDRTEDARRTPTG